MRRALSRLVRAVDDEDVRALFVAPVGKDEHDDADEKAAEHREMDEAGCEHDARGEAPEQEGYVHRVLDRGAEAHDRKRADHAERKDDVARHGEHHEGRHQRDGDERRSEIRRVHDAAVAFFVNVKNEKPDCKCEQHGNRHVDDG